MTRTKILSAALFALLGPILGGAGGLGCALTTKASPTIPRYFSPEPPEPPPLHPAATPAGFELRLGRVQAAAHIRERIVYRDAKNEMGFYDDLLWTERPDAYLRRQLQRVLFEEEGLRSVVNGAAPTLDIELVDCEELRGPRHVALVRATMILRDDRVVRVEQTLTVERPIPDVAKPDRPGAIAAALGDALRDAIRQIAERVRGDLAKGAPAGRNPTGKVEW